MDRTSRSRPVWLKRFQGKPRPPSRLRETRSAHRYHQHRGSAGRVQAMDPGTSNGGTTWPSDNWQATASTAGEARDGRACCEPLDAG
jgi:hypothetical protein